MPTFTDQRLAISRQGLLFVLSSPSGAGKTTLSRRLLEGDENLSMSVSVTTRPPRPGEENGKDYVFLEQGQFDAMKEANGLLESAEVFGNCYGTPKFATEVALEEGRDVLFDIDWQGAQSLRAARPADVVSVFILPPDAATLEKRLTTRAQDSAEVVAQRMAKASNEISHWAEYDYVIINRDLDESTETLAGILRAERHRRSRRLGLSAFVKNLQKGL